MTFHFPALFTQEKQTQVSTQRCIHGVFTAALYMIVPNWKQSESSPADEQINKS